MDSAGLQSKRDRRRLLAPQIVKSPGSVNPQQPDGLFPNIANHCLEITAVEQDGTESEGIEHVLAPIAVGIEHSPSIVIPRAR